MKKLLSFGMILTLFFNGLIAQQANSGPQSFRQRQLNRLAQSRPVREMAIFKDLPGAINRCYISKRNCAETDRRVISQALIRIPIIMVAFAAAAGIVFTRAKKDKRIPFDKLKEESKSLLKEQMVTAITKNQKKYLLDIFTKVRFPQNVQNMYLLLAVPSAESDIVELLLKEGASASAKDGKGDPALYSAARRSTFGPNEYAIARDIIIFLLQKKADVNAQGSDGRTALMWVAGAGRQDLVDMLINAGADPSTKDKLGNTVDDYVKEASAAVTFTEKR